MEQNTNRMWWAVGVLVLGAILLGGLSFFTSNNFTPKISEKMNALIKTPEPSNKINPDDAKWVEKGNWGTNGYFVSDNAGNGIVYALDPQQPVIAPETTPFTEYHENLTSLKFLDKTILPKDSSYYFSSYANLTTFDTKNLDTSNVTNMSGMFNSMYALTAIDLSKFDTSNVTDMSEMFANMPALKTLDVSKFDTSNVTDMSFMFATSGLTTLDVSKFNTSNVTNVAGMFGDMPTLTPPDTSKFDTSKMTNKDQMFTIIRLTFG